MTRILVAEDSRTQAQELRYLLEAQGYGVVLAHDGAAALERVREGDVDVVVSDVMMPRMTGHELCRAVRADPELVRVPIILMTALGEVVDVIRALESGADHFAMKPVNVGVLVRRIETTLASIGDRDDGVEPLDIAVDGRSFRIRAHPQKILEFLTASFEGYVRSKQREHEDELSRARRLLRDEVERFFDLSVDMLCVLDSKQHFAQVNPAWEEVLGYRMDELVGRSWRDFVHPDDLEESRAAMLALANGRVAFENRMRCSDGSHRWLSWRGAVHMSDGTVYAGARDITEQKDTEAAMRQTAKMEAIGRLAGGVAHDFNNLLTVILTNCHFLSEDEDLGDSGRGDLEQIHDAAKRAAGLTQQLLAFGRKQVLELSAVDVNERVEDLQRMLSRVIGEDIEMRLELSPDPRPIEADAGQIHQVLMNLAVNARDAMPNGGHLTVATSNVELDDAFVAAHRGAQTGPHVVISMIDDGMGMDAATRARLFEPFFTTKPEGRGTGLGMATVYGIVKQSRGYIDVTSAPGKGTRVDVYFPCASGDLDEAEDIDVGEGTGEGEGTILVVEDEAPLLSIVSRALRSRGYEVIEASDPEQALGLCEDPATAFDLLLVDVVMPKLTGPQLVEEVHRLRPHTRVLYMSGYSDDTIGHRGVVGSGARLLRKPFTAGELRRAVHAALAQPSPALAPLG